MLVWKLLSEECFKCLMRHNPWREEIQIFPEIPALTFQIALNNDLKWCGILRIPSSSRLDFLCLPTRVVKICNCLVKIWKHPVTSFQSARIPSEKITAWNCCKDFENIFSSVIVQFSAYSQVHGIKVCWKLSNELSPNQHSGGYLLLKEN